MTLFTVLNNKYVSKDTKDIKRGYIEFQFNEIMCNCKNMKGNNKNRSSKVNNLDNTLDYLIRSQDVMKK